MEMKGLKMNSTGFETEEARWEAVLNRDPEARSAFVYAVATTGIYCRPTCPSRRPRRRNATFYDTAALADGAGYRPCKRCRPEDESFQEKADRRIIEACRILEESEERPTLSQLAAEIGLSPFHFQRLFKETVGLTPKEYASGLRRTRLQESLKKRETVTEALYEAGLSSGSRLYENYLKMLGMKPTEYRDSGRDGEIRYALGSSTLGPVLVAATAKGVCRIDLGENEEELISRLKKDFTEARIEEGDKSFHQLVAMVTNFIEFPGKGLGLPLDIRGTAFQQKVWQALQEIPPGSTLSYGQVAAKLGRPQAARAVARACASNTLALAVPCHRVVRSDGGLGGYRWGVERKRAILEQERKTT